MLDIIHRVGIKQRSILPERTAGFENAQRVGFGVESPLRRFANRRSNSPRLLLRHRICNLQFANTIAWFEWRLQSRIENDRSGWKA